MTMTKHTQSTAKSQEPAPPSNLNPKGNKITAKTARVKAHREPERRNENKVRGR